TTVIGYVEHDSPAEKAGLHAGDKILEVDGKPVTRFSGMNNSVIWNVVRSEGATIPFKIERDGEILTFAVAPFKSETRGWRRKCARRFCLTRKSRGSEFNGMQPAKYQYRIPIRSSRFTTASPVLSTRLLPSLRPSQT